MVVIRVNDVNIHLFKFHLCVIFYCNNYNVRPWVMTLFQYLCLVFWFCLFCISFLLPKFCCTFADQWMVCKAVSIGLDQWHYQADNWDMEFGSQGVSAASEWTMRAMEWWGDSLGRASDSTLLWHKFEIRQKHKINLMSFSESKILCWLAVHVPNQPFLCHA